MKSNRSNVDTTIEESINISVPQFYIRIDFENPKDGLRRILFWLSFGWLSNANFFSKRSFLAAALM